MGTAGCGEIEYEDETENEGVKEDGAGALHGQKRCAKESVAAHVPTPLPWKQ